MIRELILPSLLLSLTAGFPSDDSADGTGPVGKATEASASRAAQLPEESLLVDRGEGELPLRIPGAEELEFRVLVDLGIGDVNVGTVTLSSGIEPYRAGLPMPGGKVGDEQMSGWLKSNAKGGHLGYELDHELKTTFQPVDFPRIFHRDTQTGSENRKREIKIGERGGKSISTFQDDGHCQGCDRPEHIVASTLPWGKDHHCKKCKRAEHRIWTEIETRDIPADAVDMLGAIYLSRTLLVEGLESTTVPMLDKTRLWNVTLRPGGTKLLKTKAGHFECTEVLLETALPEGEPVPDRGFSGIFGIRGEIHIWAETRTGVPVMIEGEVPVGGLFTLDVQVELKRHEGTPQAFQPQPK
jgi:Protein of unknown function (DUF3108)